MARIVLLSHIHLSPTHGFFWDNWCVAREFANTAKADAVIVNGDLTINGPDSDFEIAFAASALGKLRTHALTLPGSSMQIGSHDGTALLPPIALPLTPETGAWSVSTRSFSARAWSGNRHRISGSTSSYVPPDGPPLCSCTSLS